MMIRCRIAEKTDAPAIIEFNKAMALETEAKTLDPELITAGVHSLFEKPELGFYLVAGAGGEVVGSLMITKEWSDWRNGLFWWIQSVYVVPEFRRKGVYRSMYQYVQEMAKSDDEICGFRLYVEKENSVAQKTYRNLGMEETRYKLFEQMADR